MPSIWQSYVPYHVVCDLVLHPHADLVGREQCFEAVALFADVSGFTAISEALVATGKSGAEELTTIFNAYFEPVIDLIQSYGGTASGWFSATLPCTTGSVTNDEYRVVGSDEGVESTPGAAVAFTVIAPTLSLAFDQSATMVAIGETSYFTDTSTTDGTGIEACGFSESVSVPNAVTIAQVRVFLPLVLRNY